MAQVYSSDWGGLNRHLIASFYPMERKEDPATKVYSWVRVADASEVRAPLTEATIEHVSNWHSPFENVGADQKFSAMSAIFQSGALAALVSQFKDFLGRNGAGDNAVTDAASKLQGLEGRTSVTKLSSRQVYSGSPPMKIQMTAHFRALFDPLNEVERPINELMSWFLPQELAEDGLVLTLANGGAPSLYPSRIPRYIGMRYADTLFEPMVLEAMPLPLTGPRDKNGRLIQASIQLTLASLTSLDANDWRKVRYR